MQLKQPRIEVPPTSMAAHVADEDVDIELYNGTDVNETANTENENGVAYKVKAAPLMLPPALIPRSNYSQVSSSWVPILFLKALLRNSNFMCSTRVTTRMLMWMADEEAAGSHVV